MEIYRTSKIALSISCFIVLLAVSCTAQINNSTTTEPSVESEKPLKSYENIDGEWIELTEEEAKARRGNRTIKKTKDGPQHMRKVDGKWVELTEAEVLEREEKKRNRKPRKKILPNYDSPDTMSSEEVSFLDKIKHTELVEVIAQFAAGSSSPILVNDSEMIKSLVEKINNSPKNSYVIVGHTNSQGSKISNITLSLKRATATEAVLVKEYGLDRTKLEHGGAGEELPLFENTTSANRKKNSRVEIRAYVKK